MAVVHPSLDGFQPASAGQARELDVLRHLADGLPDDHAVFHSVLWSSVERGRQRFGEIDTMVLSPAGHVALLEVKAGPVEFSVDGIGKRYDDRAKDVLGQLRMQYGALRQRLKEAGLRVFLAQFLVVPDVRVTGDTVAYPRKRIVDKDDFPWLAERVRAAIPDDAPDPVRFARVRDFLANVFALAPDPTARIGLLNATVDVLLADGLATWAPRVSSVNGRVLVRATAGSGKTQLAVELLREAARSGLRAAYRCFNRPLADHLRQVLPEHEVCIATFHEKVIGAWRCRHGVPDFGSGLVFEQASKAWCEAAAEPEFDVLVLDEAQDFAPEWVAALLRQVKPGGRVYALLDEDQQLYLHGGGDVAAVLGAAAELRDWDNFRSPRAIVNAINALRLTDEPVVARCPVVGEAPGFHVWPESDKDGLETVAQVVRGLLAEGVQVEQIVLLSLAGRKRSHLLRQFDMEGVALRVFDGCFDADGEPCWRDGVLLAETVYRFKGQAAPVVVLCEVDFDEVDALTRRRLFVGMTRARWRLECVLSERAAVALARRLESN